MKARESKEYCGLVAETFSAYLDRSLPASLEREISQHMEECEECRGRLEGVKALIVDLGRLGGEEAPTELGWSIKRVVGKQARREAATPIVRPIPFLTSAAAAAAALLVISLSGTGGTEPFQTSAIDPSTLQAEQPPVVEPQFALPAEMGAMQASPLLDNTMTANDSTSGRMPSRLRGARAVSF